MVNLAFSPEPQRAACLALVTEAFGGQGGIAQFNRDILGALDRSGLFGDVVIAPRLGDAPAPATCPSLAQAAPRFHKGAYALGCLRQAVRLHPQILLNGHLYHGPLAQRLSRMMGARLVSILHGTEVWRPMRPTHLQALKASDMVVCVSHDTRARFLAQAGVAPPRTVVLHNTVDPRFSPGDRAAARRRFDLDDMPVVLTVGRLDDRSGYKGHDRILLVLADLRDRGRPARYLIAGQGPDRPRLEAIARAHGVERFVRFLGHVPDADLPELYRAADVFALPSTGEGFGIVYLEAMACGTPAIGLRVGGATEALGDLGRAVAPDDFAEALMAMLTTPPPNPQLLSAGVVARFGRDVFDRRVATIASELLTS